MAIEIEQLESITHKYVIPRLFDNFFDSNGLCNKLLKSGQYKSVNGGTTIDIPLAYAAAGASGWFDGSDSLSTEDVEQLTAARYQWASVFSGVTLSKKDIALNAGDAGVVKLLASKVSLAEKTIKDLMGTGLFSDGTNTKSIVGLRDICDNDQVVGGVNQATNSWWQSNLDESTTTLSLSALNLQYENACVDDEKPNLIVSNRTPFTKFYNLLTPLQRFTDKETAGAGFSNLLFNNVPWITDSHCPALHIFGLNLNHLWLCYHPDMNFTMDPWVEPTNSRVRISRIVWMGALGSSNNNRHFCLNAIAA
jgi:hypothetical protein